VKITVLGTSAAWPIPRLGCDCEQCTSDDPRDRRLRPALLVEGRVLIDAGPDVYHQLRRAGAVPEDVVLTHAHADHVLGMHDLTKLGRLPLHASRETLSALRGLFPRIDLRPLALAPGATLDLGDGLVLQAFDVEHGGDRTYGLRLRGGAGETLVYVPDAGAPPSSRLARDADLLLLDGATRERAMRGHLSMAAGVEAARRLRARRTLFTHIGHRTGTHAELERWLPEGFGVAYDGEEIALEPAPPARRGR
jgi:phosphoribosyl 1,2-cyclic phosphate phosphodiesterase